MEHRTANSDNEPLFSLLSPDNLSPSSSNRGFSHVNLRRGDNPDFAGDGVLPNYDFHPIRRGGGANSSTGLSNSSSGASMEDGAMNSSRHRQVPSAACPAVGSTAYMKGESSDLLSSASRRENDMDGYHCAVVSAVERVMKKYADNLLRVLEGMTAQLSQLELTARGLEHLLGELKETVGNNHGEADGRFRVVNNHLLEVHRTVQLLRDKQEIAEAQAELVKLQISKDEISSKKSNTEPAWEDRLQAKPADPTLPEWQGQQHLLSLPMLPAPQLPATLSQLQTPLMHSLPAVPKAEPTSEPDVHHESSLSSSSYVVPQLPVYYSQNTQMQLPVQKVQVPQSPVQQPLAPQTQIQPALPPHIQVHQPMPLQAQFQLPVTQQAQLQQPLPQQAHIQQPILQQPVMQQQLQQPPVHAQSIQQPLPTPQMQVQQATGGQSHLLTTQLQRVSQVPFQQYTHQPEGPSYGSLPPQSQAPPLSGSYSTQQLAYNSSNYAEPLQQLLPSGPLASQQQHVIPQTYGSSLQRNNPPSPAYLAYGSQGMTSSGGYGNPMYRVAQPVTSFPSGYTRLPAAQPVSSGLSSSGILQVAPPGGGNPQVNRVPADEIAEKVAAMGFSRDEAKIVVQNLTENGQSVDLNVVLDKLMNGGMHDRHQRGWYGR